MKKVILPSLLTICFFCIKTNAQQNIGIGTSTPHSSSLLDVKSNNKGMLVPRINLLSETDVVTIAAPAISLLVYNINNTLTDGEGFYFWNGIKWSKLINRANVANLAWGVMGNSGTNATTDFIGTTDNKALVFKTNNILSGKIDPGPNNVFFGQSAGTAITSGVNNTFIGHIAGAADSSGSDNLFVGHFAGNANTRGSENVFVGQDAGRNNRGGNRNTFVGEDAGIENTADDNVFIGNGAGRNNSNGNQNVALGNSALSNNISGNQNAAFGHNALLNNTKGDNSAMGFEALKSNTTGSSNSAFGSEALQDNTTGIYNSAFGRSPLWNNTTGVNNVAFGAYALSDNKTGSNNIGIGTFALQYNIIGGDNIAIGHFSGPPFNLIEDLNNSTAIGVRAVVTKSNTMVFGSSDVDNWAFGLTETGFGHAFEIGSNSINGNGAFLTNGGVWTNTSSKIKKEDFSDVNGLELLQKIQLMPVQRWKYKGTNEYHIGPVAEDFYKLFGLGTDDKGISTVDPAGIALAAIQEQQKIIEKQNELILLLEKRIEALEKK